MCSARESLNTSYNVLSPCKMPRLCFYSKMCSSLLTLLSLLAGATYKLSLLVCRFEVLSPSLLTNLSWCWRRRTAMHIFSTTTTTTTATTSPTSCSVVIARPGCRCRGGRKGDVGLLEGVSRHYCSYPVLFYLHTSLSC